MGRKKTHRGGIDRDFKLPGLGDIGDNNRIRNETEKAVFIMNPNARGGRARQQLEELSREIKRVFRHATIQQTARPLHATELSRQAVDDGADLVIAVGGDGTCNEVLNGLYDGDRPRRRSVVFSTIRLGTGGDLARTLNAPVRMKDALWMVAMGMTLPTDVGHIQFQRPSGETGEQVFLNVAGFGLNGEVSHQVNSGKKRLGSLSFLTAGLRALGRYKPQPVQLEWQAGSETGQWEGELLLGFVANAKYCGGGMYVGPRSSMYDGLFDVTLLPPQAGAPHHAWRLYTGSLDRLPGARFFRAHSLKVTTPADNMRLDVDGEGPGVLPASFQVIHRGLHVRGGWLKSPLLDEDHPEWKPGATRL